MFGNYFLCLFEQLRPVFRSQHHNFLHELGLLGFIELRRRCGPSRNRRSDCCEKLLLPGRRADAEQPGSVGRYIVKTMWRVGGNVDGVSCFHNRFLTTKRCLHLTFQKNKSLIEVVPMWGRPTCRWNVHIYHAESPCCFRSGDGDGVGVSDQTNVRKSFILINLSNRQISLQVVGRKWGILGC